MRRVWVGRLVGGGEGEGEARRTGAYDGHEEDAMVGVVGDETVLQLLDAVRVWGQGGGVEDFDAAWEHLGWVVVVFDLS